MERLVLMGIPKEMMLENNLDYQSLIKYEPKILSLYPEKEFFSRNNTSEEKFIGNIDNK